jgi:hypothetical protein
MLSNSKVSATKKVQEVLPEERLSGSRKRMQWPGQRFVQAFVESSRFVKIMKTLEYRPKQTSHAVFNMGGLSPSMPESDRSFLCCRAFAAVNACGGHE